MLEPKIIKISRFFLFILSFSSINHLSATLARTVDSLGRGYATFLAEPAPLNAAVGGRKLAKSLLLEARARAATVGLVLKHTLVSCGDGALINLGPPYQSNVQRV